MRIAVTGAAGHIGNNLCRELIKRGHKVNALVFNDTKALSDLPVNLVVGDVTDPYSLDILLHNAEVVCHLAAIISISGDKGGMVQKINVEGTRNVIDSAIRNGVKKMYHTSSIHAHKSPGLEGVMDEKYPYADAADYAYDQSKAISEALVLEAREKGIATTIFNPTGVIGPFDFKMSYSGQFILQLCKGEIPMLTPLGFDWVDVRDVSWAIAEAIDKSIENEKFLISGTWVSIKEFAAIVAKYSGQKAPRFVAPFWVSRLGVPFIAAISKLTGKEPVYSHESLDAIIHGCKNVRSNHAADLLGYKAKPIEQVLEETILWYKNQRLI
jgi:dihydroflavonol-4-reductase